MKIARFNAGQGPRLGVVQGVGAGMVPPEFLQPGDVVRCEVEKIGAIENRVTRPA